MITIMDGEKIDAIISSEGSKQVKVLSIFTIVLPIIITYFINYKFDMGWNYLGIVLVYSLVVTILLVIYKTLCNNLYKNRKSVSFDSIKKTAKSGDIVLFKTNESYDVPEFIYYRLLLLLTTQSDWSHVGLVVKCPKTGKLYIWESSESPSFDHMTKKDVSGIKLMDFDEKIKEYHGYVGYRKLNRPLSKRKCIELLNMCKKYKGIPFRKKIFGDKGINCAEAVSELLEKTNIYKTRKKVMKMLPCNFSSTCNNYSKMVWGEDVLIKDLSKEKSDDKSKEKNKKDGNKNQKV